MLEKSKDQNDCVEGDCELVDVDPNEKGYIVTKKIGRSLPLLTRELTERVVETLFLEDPPLNYKDYMLEESVEPLTKKGSR